MSSTNPIPTSPPASKDPPPSNRPPSNNMPPPPRPLLTTRTPSLTFDPQAHLLSPSPLLPPETTSQYSISQSHSTPLPQSQQQQQRITPFFTLITDTSTQSTHHPSKIHYIFSDDDASGLLTSSLLKSALHIQTQTQNQNQSSLSTSRESPHHEGGTTTTTSSSSSTNLRKPIHNQKNNHNNSREERVIIIDLDASLTNVEKISSLSPEWQVLSAGVERAPSFDPAGGGEGVDVED